MTELSLATTKLINLNKSDLTVIVDSLSTLAIYHSAGTLTRFIHDLVNKVRAKATIVLVLTISDKDKDSKFIKDAEIMVDKVINLAS